MKQHLTLEKALKKVYKKKVKAVIDISSNWSLFQPYQVGQINIAYYKLIQIPNFYHTSSQIYLKTLNQFSEVIHEVELILVERCFQCSYYLVKSNKNIISLKNLIELNRDSSQIIQKDIIYKFLQFTSLLQKFRILNLSLEEIGLTYDGKFILTKYLLFFRTEECMENIFTQDIQKLLASMILLETSQKINYDELYSICLENYGQQLLQIIKKGIQNKVSTDDILIFIQSVRQNSNFQKKNTLTDSFISSYNDNQYKDQNILEESFTSDTFVQSFKKVKKDQKMNKRNIIFFVLIFLILSSIAAFIIFILIHHTIICGQAQYLDEYHNKCFQCPANCSSCKSGKQQQCLSCIFGKILIVKDENELIGQCSQNCYGCFIKQNICLQNNE